MDDINNRLEEHQLYEIALQWLNEKGKLSVIPVTISNIEEYELKYTPNNGGKTVNRKDIDSVRLTIDFYNELKG